MPPKNRDVERALREEGYLFKDQVGSHRHFEHAVTGLKVTIVGEPGDEMRRGTLHALLKYAGIKRKQGW
jgi:predicted RNA binding protein YcfA (HicA-like mRNA interferase family)